MFRVGVTNSSSRESEPVVLVRQDELGLLFLDDEEVLELVRARGCLKEKGSVRREGGEERGIDDEGG